VTPIRAIYAEKGTTQNPGHRDRDLPAIRAVATPGYLAAQPGGAGCRRVAPACPPRFPAGIITYIPPGGHPSPDDRMRIGILADTHDNLPMIDRAVARLSSLSPDLVLHAGDFVSPFVIPRLAALSCPCIGVFGNNDGDRALLAAKAGESGRVEIHGSFMARLAGGKSLALLHGHEPGTLEEVAAAGIFDLVVHGHTHQPSVAWLGRTLLVNPGEVCGYLTGRGTVAILETGPMEAEILGIGEDPLPGA
jgi:putative phosphoesterase